MWRCRWYVPLGLGCWCPAGTALQGWHGGELCSALPGLLVLAQQDWVQERFWQTPVAISSTSSFPEAHPQAAMPGPQGRVQRGGDVPLLGAGGSGTRGDGHNLC